MWIVNIRDESLSLRDERQGKSAKSNSFRELYSGRRLQLILKYFSKTISPLIWATLIPAQQWQPDWMQKMRENERESEWERENNKKYQSNNFLLVAKQNKTTRWNVICPNSFETRNLSDLSLSENVKIDEQLQQQ